MFASEILKDRNHRPCGDLYQVVIWKTANKNVEGAKYEELVVYAGSEWAYSNTKADKTENYTLAGVSAYREDNPAGQNPAETLIYVKSGKYYYTIHQTKDENDANIEKVFDQILSTFKFVE